ncbi:MAG: hypothetical protein WKG03_08440, partial [Telluria sp.]
SNGQILSDLQYLLTLDDGTTVEGTTDKKGLTKRIRTKKPVAIKKAQVRPAAPKIPSRAAAAAAAGIAHSCTLHATGGLPDFLTIELNGIKITGKSTNWCTYDSARKSVDFQSSAARQDH